MNKYDQLVQACLATGAFCMIDIHNFARYNGGIIGQGGPTDDQFVALWTQLATKYAANDKLIFEIMNEPHELDVPLWAATCQKVVTAIRNAGAKTQIILLPGTNFDSAATLVSSGSAAALMAITNPDGTTNNLLLDIHKYLDIDNSGTHAECVTDNIGNFSIVADFLRANKRLGLVSETGASSDPSVSLLSFYLRPRCLADAQPAISKCLDKFCAQNNFIVANSDVFVGLVGWAAGSFSTSYVLSMVPTRSNNRFVDNELCTKCLVGAVMNGNGTVPRPPLPSPTNPSSPSQTQGSPASSSVSSRVTIGSSVASSISLSRTGSVSFVSGTPSTVTSRAPNATTTNFSPTQTVSRNGGSMLRGVVQWIELTVVLAVAAL